MLLTFYDYISTLEEYFESDIVGKKMQKSYFFCA